MHIRVNIGGEPYRIQFRLAVICQLLKEEGKNGLTLRAESTAVCNPQDEFRLWTGMRLAFDRLLRAIPFDGSAHWPPARYQRRMLWSKLVAHIKAAPRRLDADPTKDRLKRAIKSAQRLLRAAS